jgi:hypothetical protein
MSEQEKRKYDIHPAAEMFPMMTDDEYAGLKQDIAENGQRDDIISWGGKIIDGRNRLRACEELGIEPSIVDLHEHLDPWKYVISHNLHRRHLNVGQRAMVAATMATMQRGQNQHTSNDAPSIESAACQLNVGKSTVERARAVKDKGTQELADMVRDGNVSVNAASKVASKPKAEQKKIVAKGPVAVKEAAKTVPKRLAKTKPLPPTVMSKSPDELTPSIQAAGERLPALVKELERLTAQIGGEHLDLELQGIETSALQLRRIIRDSVYWRDCMSCNGKGKKCNTCRNIGWLSLNRKQFLTQRERDLAGIK